MAYVRGLRLTFIVLLMIVGMVKGRWLELEPYSTQSMISDGIHDMNLRMGASNYSVPTTMLYGGKRCESIYGFLPCADTVGEGVFLMLMYTYLMMLGEDWIRKGGEDLFQLLGDKAIGASVFKVLMALPRVVVVIVAGIVSTESSAQDQVVFGASMYAGSTLITLTFIWGLCITLNRDKLRGMEPEQVYENRQDSLTKCLPLRHKLSFLNDNGVNIDDMTGDTAIIMLLSLIPFATVELLSLINSPVTILSTLIVSGVSLVLYFGYQIWRPLARHRCLAYLREETLQVKFLYNVQRLGKGDLCDQDGNPDFEEFESLFAKADEDNDGSIGQNELIDMIEKVFVQENDHISKEYAKVEILSHFDDDKNGEISLDEFKKGCTKWLKKWKEVENDLNHVSKHLVQDSWEEIDKRINMEKPKSYFKSVLCLVFGVGIMFVISGAFMQSILQFSNACNMSFDFTSFVVFPIAMNAKMIITSLLEYGSKVSKNASLTFSEMYDRLVMNNLLGLVTLLITVHMKGLSWTYSNEMLTIMIPCAVVGLFAFSRDTYPLWASITGMLLYPIYVCVFCVSWF